MDLKTQSASMAHYRAITQIGKHDAAYTAAEAELAAALKDMPHRHSGIDPTDEQNRRLKRASASRNRERDRLTAIFDVAMAQTGKPFDPAVMGSMVDVLIETTIKPANPS